MTQLVHVVGWTLVHFVWQGLCVAVMVAGLLALGRRSAATIRYGVASVGLAVMAVMPLITVPVLWATAGTGVPPDGAGARLVWDAVSVTGLGGAVAVDHGAGPSVQSWVDALLPGIVGFWLVGVVVLLARTAGGLYRVHRLRARVSALPDSRWQRLASRLLASAGSSRLVRVVESALVESPMVLGWLQPIVVLPLAGLSHLTPAQVEAILAHELAHVRRQDYLVNVLQTLVETLLFYHPAVWWLSRIVREEREHCCDDVAVAVCGDAAGYATALVTLEAERSHRLALAARRGALSRRVRRLLGASPSSEPRGVGATVSAATALVLVAILGSVLPGTDTSSLAFAQDPPGLSRDDLEWRVSDGDRFTVHHYPALASDLEAVEAAADLAYERVSTSLDHDLGFKVPLVLFKTRADFDRQAVAPEADVSFIRSFSEPAGNRIVLLVDENRDDLPTRLTHELTHIFMFDLVPRSPIRPTVPLWVDEGVADYVTGVWPPDDLTLLLEAVAGDQVPSLADPQMQWAFVNARLVYALGHAAFEFIEARWGQPAVRRFLEGFRSASAEDHAAVYQDVLGLAPAEFDAAFLQYLQQRFGPA